jgi:hypothetical protein
MPLIQIILTLIVVGVLLWLAEPMADPMKTIRAVVVIAVALWLLQVVGLLPYLRGAHAPVLR